MKRSLPILILCALITISCTKPQIHTQGYVVKEKELEMLNIGQTTKKDVLRTLGTPSTLNSFDAKKWYYISEQITTKVMDRKELNSRQIIILAFNDKDILTHIQFKEKADGHYVKPSALSTKTQGKKLTILDQMLGNLGRSF